MSEQLYNFLFNPNHEMPSIKVLVVLLAIVVITSILRSYFERK